MTRVQAGEVNLEYEIHGNAGDWVLLIQGLGYAKWGWNWTVPGLAGRFRVITFDNRGVGDSDAPPGPYTAKEMAADTAALLDALGIEKTHVVGTSLGGFIAQELTIARPDLVERLALVCTGFGGPRFVPMPDITVQLLREMANWTQEERLYRSTANALAPGVAEQRPDLVETIVAHRSRVGQSWEAWSWQANAGATFDSSDRVGEIKQETLVVTGTQDNVIDYRNSALLAEELENATLHEMDGGHLFFIEHAERFNDLLARFLAGEPFEEEEVSS